LELQEPLNRNLQFSVQIRTEPLCVAYLSIW
jgi:hypothetical protein